MIKYIAEVERSSQTNLYPVMEPGTFEEFKRFLIDQDTIQLDVETQVLNPICMVQLRLRTIQFGEYAPICFDKNQWVIEWSKLSKAEKIWILSFLQDPKVLKIIHNAAFEVQVFMNYGCYLENVVDTMLNEKIIYTGHKAVLDEENAQFFSLEGVTRRRLNVDRDKTYQIMFDPEYALTEGHIQYAADDVRDMDIILDKQRDDLNSIEHYGAVPEEERTVFNHLPTLENEAVLAFSEIMWNGLKVDQEKWKQNASEAQPIVDKFKASLEEYLINDKALNARAIDLGYIATHDLIEINWKSPKDKTELVMYAFPDIPGATKAILQRYLKDNKALYETAAGPVIYELSQGNPQPFYDMLLEYCREDMITMGYLIPKGTIRINWGSWQQVLPLIQSVHKTLKSTAEEALNKVKHPVAFALLDYRGSKMLTTTYGIDFLQKLDFDGKVRTDFNQILETGRVSSAKPNMQQIPVIDDDDPVIMNKYRNCFIPDFPDQVFVDGDYASQELVVIASLSKDPVWMEALRAGHDLHSICASLVYGRDWINMAQPDCKFVKSRQKCKCPGHKRMRTAVKTINFG